MVPPLLLFLLTSLLALTMPASAAGGGGHGNGKSHTKSKSSCKKDICKILATSLPSQLISLPSSPSYSQHISSYWSLRQSDLKPGCFVTPLTTNHLSTTVRLLTKHNAPFTVKAGGHTAFEGGSSVSGKGTVVIDLAELNSITVSDDRKTVTLGPGARWANVSAVLEPLGLAVVGGRAGSVGVAGLLLGGGISYFSGRRGWACDNVKAYEVVLASGEVVRATATEREDLYWALRGGGGSNFGVVAGFELEAFEFEGPMWASRQLWPGSANQTLIPKVHDLLVNGLLEDVDAHNWFVITYFPEFGGTLVVMDQFHPTHKDLKTPPVTFAPFHDDTAPSTILTDIHFANMSRLLVDADQPRDLRHTWWNTVVKATSTPDLLLDIEKIYESHLEKLLAASGPEGMWAAIIFQSIPTNVLEAMQANGGNALGLTPDEGPLVLIQLHAQWSDPGMDATVESTCEDTISKIDTLAASRGARTKNGFIYMNYASKKQDVFAGYGTENRERLRQIAKKYDPKGKLQKLWRGYFKV